MKLSLLSLFLIFLSAAASAATPPLPTPVTPLRQAKVHAQVNKTHLAYADIGENDEKIFEGDAEWPVYGYPKDDKEWRAQGNFPLIPTTVRGQPIRVQVSGSVEFLAATDKAPAKKRVQGVLFMTYANGDVHSSQPFLTATTDLNTKNLEFYVSSAMYDFPGLPRGTEALRVWITVNDVNQ